MDAKEKRKLLNQKPVTLTHAEIQKMKEDATLAAIEAVLVVPLLVLRDDFGFGKKRLAHFQERLRKQLDLASEGYVSLQDIRKVLADELGVKVE